MYASHFGLSKRLFRGNLHGSDVFVGPQTASLMSALKKALSAEDAVITVSGPAGVGKTTIVRRALENIGANRIVITVGRMHLGHDEVIELLLAGLGARQLPKSMIHRFAMFRRLLSQYSDKGTRIFIVVEDATRVGLDALSELEALTAEDSGASSGASLVLMGTEGTAELLRSPELVRLKQRVRLRQAVKPLGAGELRGYLKHCFRVAGGDFDAVFEAGCGDTLHQLSNGTPRLVNNIVEQALNTAAEQNLNKLSASFVERVAADEIGLTAEHSAAEIQVAMKQSADAADNPEANSTELSQSLDEAVDAGSDMTAGPEDEEAVQAGTDMTAGPKDEETVQAGSDMAADPDDEETVEADSDLPADQEEIEDQANILPPAATGRDNQETAEAVSGAEARTTGDAAAPVDSNSATETPVLPDDEDIPNLIQDTRPDLEVLAPETGATNTEIEELDSLFADDDDDLPTLFSSQTLESPAYAAPVQQAAAPVSDPGPEIAMPASAGRETGSAGSGNEEVPAWERDPTLAELRPDLEALERAMAAAQGLDEEVEPVKAAVDKEEDIPELVPEITLDREIQAKIDEATEALRQTHYDLEPVQTESEDQSLEASLTPSEKVEQIKQPAKDSKTPTEVKPGAPDIAANAAEKPKAPRHFRDTGELKRVASGLASARSLEDVDDRMAETLFGEEFSMAAAEVAASIAASKPANDELQLVDDVPKDGSSRSKDAGTDVNGHEMSKASKRRAPEKIRLDPKASERLATVRALNNGSAPAGTPPSLSEGESIVMSEGYSPARPRKPEEMPLSIEDQINSATQTLKTLKIPPSALADNDDDDRPKGGFFSRFKRS